MARRARAVARLAGAARVLGRTRVRVGPRARARARAGLGLGSRVRAES